MNKNKFIRSFGFAIMGIIHAFRSQWNFRFHIYTSCVVIFSAILLQLTVLEWCIILLCLGSVIATELINTAIEINIDLTSPEFNKKAGHAKDVAAGAVLITSLIAAIIGLIIFIPKIIHIY